MTDSLYAAAKQVAITSRLSWTVVFRTYREMQAAGLLPVSRGRAWVAATPTAVATLLIGLAMRDTDTPRDNVVAFQSAGGSIESEWLVTKLAALLTDPVAAVDLDSVVFEIDAGQAVVTTAGRPSVFSADPDFGRLIQTRSAIAGDLFRQLQAAIQYEAVSC